MQWEDLSGVNQPFASNGNPVHRASTGVYSFSRDGLFAGNAMDESVFDFDTDQGGGATPFNVVTAPPEFSIKSTRIIETHGFNIATQQGVLYRLESSDNGAAGGPWTDTGGRVMGDGGMKILFDPDGYSSEKTYRLDLD